MSEEKVLVGVRITEERRDEWKRFVEDSDEYSSMAALMRSGVNRIMTDEEQNDNPLINKLNILIDDMYTIRGEIQYFREENKDLIESIDDAEDIAEEVVYLTEKISSDELGDL